MLSNSRGSLPIIFLVTDGTVEDERQICDEIKKCLASEDAISPRISTFGIGPLVFEFSKELDQEVSENNVATGD
ncbi:hypothetical protein ABKV19_008616 [Rosa sericea]